MHIGSVDEATPDDLVEAVGLYATLSEHQTTLLHDSYDYDLGHDFLLIYLLFLIHCPFQ